PTNGTAASRSTVSPSTFHDLRPAIDMTATAAIRASTGPREPPSANMNRMGLATRMGHNRRSASTYALAIRREYPMTSDCEIGFRASATRKRPLAASPPLRYDMSTIALRPRLHAVIATKNGRRSRVSKELPSTKGTMALATEYAHISSSSGVALGHMLQFT